MWVMTFLIRKSNSVNIGNIIPKSNYICKSNSFNAFTYNLIINDAIYYHNPDTFNPNHCILQQLNQYGTKVT